MSVSLQLLPGYNSITLIMEAADSSETLVAIHNPTQCQKLVLEL
jgi:hypothetical protein